MAEPERPQEIVIIRRRASSDMDAVKGGVWKIAFADFMTAMMAFFLVMWLINAANEETKQAVASYFNPVKLSSISTKGLEDPGVSGPPPAEPKPEGVKPDAKPNSEGAAEEPGASAAAQHPTFTEEALFRDPYAVLAELAGKGEGSAEALSLAGIESGGIGSTGGLNGGEAFRDPFDPAFWQDVDPIRTPALQQPAEAADDEGAPATEPRGPAEGTASQDAPPAESAPAPPLVAIEPAVVRSEAAAEPAQEPASMGPPPVPRRIEEREAIQEARQAETKAAGNSELQSELIEALEGEAGSQRAPNIEVTRTGEGVLISLTDDLEFGMFAIGSAEPQPEVITIMQKIAAILADKPGGIIIRGHTDGRPFKSDSYDNWRLSTARAHMAYYMLVRGGLGEDRVEQIEGHADRALRLPDDPEAAENRRIEILVREASS